MKSIIYQFQLEKEPWLITVTIKGGIRVNLYNIHVGLCLELSEIIQSYQVRQILIILETGLMPISICKQNAWDISRQAQTSTRSFEAREISRAENFLAYTIEHLPSSLLETESLHKIADNQ